MSHFTLVKKMRLALLLPLTRSLFSRPTALPPRPATRTAAVRAMSAADPRTERPPREYTTAFQDLSQQDLMMRPIGHVESPYKERFGTPRQAVVTNYTMGGVAQEGTIVLRRDFPYKEALRDLEGFSHLWIIWHAHLNHGWKAMVTPPRGPKGKRFGLFATRAPHRPNQIGLSALEIAHVDVQRGRVVVKGLDILDGTPVLDLKPYVPYCDAFPRARAGWIDELDGGGGAVQPDRLDYWPPPTHLQPASLSSRAEGEDADGDGDGSGGGVGAGNGSSER